VPVILRGNWYPSSIGLRENMPEIAHRVEARPQEITDRAQDTFGVRTPPECEEFLPHTRDEIENRLLGSTGAGAGRPESARPGDSSIPGFPGSGWSPGRGYSGYYAMIAPLLAGQRSGNTLEEPAEE
jgi:hypothetical protein